MEIIVKLKEILKEKGITQQQLAEKTGLRQSTISELANNQRSVINKEHIIKVCTALDIKNLSDIIDMTE